MSARPTRRRRSSWYRRIERPGRDHARTPALPSDCATGSGCTRREDSLSRLDGLSLPALPVERLRHCSSLIGWHRGPAAPHPLHCQRQVSPHTGRRAMHQPTEIVAESPSGTRRSLHSADSTEVSMPTPERGCRRPRGSSGRRDSAPPLERCGSARLPKPIHHDRRTGQMWSGWGDSNSRPPAPKAGALPSCATPRIRPIGLDEPTDDQSAIALPVPSVGAAQERSPTASPAAPNATLN